MMSTNQKPPTLVDLAALLREASPFGSALYRQRTLDAANAIDAHLASLRALAERWEFMECRSDHERFAYKQAASELRALLGEKA